ncbi:MAG: hypothetical protein JO227_01400 [Acetobacteraceae bacterium]|nr:hypothetical protein [Acetobacteraceae bacterium]
MSHAVVEGAVDLREARRSMLELIDSTGKSDLILADSQSRAVQWATTGRATSRARSAERGCRGRAGYDPWPDRLSLQGFAYDHLAGFGGETSEEVTRPLGWWRNQRVNGRFVKGFSGDPGSRPKSLPAVQAAARE